MRIPENPRRKKITVAVWNINSDEPEKHIIYDSLTDFKDTNKT